jgi:hypothetical protein
MLIQLFVAVLLVLGAQSQNCAQGDSLECVSSLCFNYYYSNSTCNLNGTSSCGTGQAFFQNTCVTCAGLGMANCSSMCVNYYYYTPSGSSAASCTSCETLYGTNCIQCTGSVCLACRFSSNTTLAANGKSCINENCVDSNCI